MKITRDHLAFWAARNAPSWARTIAKPAAPPSIHTLINAQMPELRRDTRNDVYNMVETLKIARKNEARGMGRGLLACLRSYAGPTYSTTSKRQAATARKWLQRIEERQQ